MKLTPSLLLLTLCLSAPAEQLLVNGGFEGEYDRNGIAPDWRDNSYSSKPPCEIQYARETEGVHGGKACQRVACNRLGYLSLDRQGHAYHGAMQLLASKDLPLRKGAVYRVRVALRADRTVPVEVLLRLRKEPWTKYVTRTVAACPQWREVDCFCRSTVDDPTAAFFVRTEYLGTVWVDDASVEELTPAALEALTPPVKPGNLLLNGDFSLGRADWSGERGWDVLDDATFSVVEDHGNPCLRAEIPAGAGKIILSDPMPIVPNRPLRVSCRVRATVPTEITLSAQYQARQFELPAFCRVKKTVGPEWQTLEASGQAGFPIGTPHAFATVLFTGPGPVYLDDVVLRQDEGELPPLPLRAAVVPGRYPQALYQEGEPVGLRVVCSRPVGEAPLLKWSVEDVLGQTVLHGDWRPPVGQASLPIDAVKLPRGYYHATVRWQAGGEERRHESTFVILPPPERHGPLATSPFGGHFMLGRMHLKLARAVGLRWIRLWPPSLTTWQTVEPERGKWRWRDAEVKRLADAGFGIIGMLESPPSWAKWGDESRWQDWENYVATVVGHYRDSIHVWEVENEPNLVWWWLEKPEGGRRAQEHMLHLQHSYAVVKRVAPEAIVYGGCVGGDFSLGTDSLGFTQELIAQGALQHMDVLSYHYYHTYADPQPVDERADPIAAAIARMKQAMRATGRELPIVNSEGGTYNPAPVITTRPCAPDNYDPLDGRTVARLMVRQYVSQWAAGVERFCYYNCFIDGMPVARPWDSFVEGDGQPRPTVTAYATMTWLLDGATFERSEHPGENVWLHRFRTSLGTLVVAWSRTGTQVEHIFPKAQRAWNMAGTELPAPVSSLKLTPDPVYVLLSQ